MSAFWTEAAILAGFLGYVIYVNRPVSRYRMRMHCDAPPDIVWLAHHFLPERPDLWLKEIASVTWEDEARKTCRITYKHGKVEALVRTIGEVSQTLSLSEGAYIRTSDKRLLNTFHSEIRFAPKNDGVIVTTDLTFVRESWLAGFGMRLMFPFLGLIMRGRIEGNIKKQIADQAIEGHSGAVRIEGGAHALVARLGGWPIVLSVAAVLWFVIDLGLWPGLVLIGTIVLHEGGHLWSMRRHGIAAKATLVPFFGGVAYGSEPLPTDASDAEVILMGPVFGLGFAGLLYLLAQLLPEPDFWMAAAGAAAIINGFNLLPIVPLDGGQLTTLLLRRYGPKVVTRASLGMVAAGVGLSWWLSSLVLLVLIVALGTMIAFSPPRGIVRPPMNNVSAMIVLGAYLALIFGHAMLVESILGEIEFSEWFGPLMQGPFGR